MQRLGRRRRRRSILVLMQRLLESCEDDGMVEMIALDLAAWAFDIDDKYAIKLAEKMVGGLAIAPFDSGPIVNLT